MITCPHCNMIVAKIPVNWKCPHCNERLPDPTRWERFTEGFGEYIENKGVIFWSIAFFILLIAIAVVDITLSRGFLFSYIIKNLLLTILFVFFGGMLINMYMKIIVPLHLMGGGDFVMHERQVIRNFRKWTHVSVVVGLAFSLIVLRPAMFADYFPSYLLLIGWCMSLAWSVLGLFINPQWLEDVRFRAFLEERLGITSLKRYRKLSVYFIIALLFEVVLYLFLRHVHGIWDSIQNTAVIGHVILFIKQYLGWVF